VERFVIILFVGCLFLGCSSSNRTSDSTNVIPANAIRMKRCWTDNDIEYSSVSFYDTIKTPIPFDTVYILINNTSKRNFTVTYSTYSLSNDTMMIHAIISGEKIYGDYLEPRNTLKWKHDTLHVFFNYHDINSSSVTSGNPTFTIDKVSIYFPIIKTVKYLY
jgi:hypothetical protein